MMRNRLWKKRIVGVILLFLVTSVITSTGFVIPEKPVHTAEQTTTQSDCFSETLSKYGSDKRSSPSISQNELRLLPPSIIFPLPGEVFRVGDVIEINGTASMPNFQNYTLKWGVGLTPTEWNITGVILLNNGTVELINTTLGFWNTTVITEVGYYTLQLMVNLIGSEQHTVNVSVYLDPVLHVNFPYGWPHQIQGSQVAIWSPIALSDINQDGYQEIGFGTVTVVPAGDNNNDYVIDHTGNLLAGWPIQLYGIQGASLTFADIEHSTSNDEVIGGMWGNKIYVWYDDGTEVEGWPKNIPASRSSATVDDIDNDGDFEIVLPTTDGGGQIYAWHHDGTAVEGWPVYIGSPIRAAASTEDVDQDGYAEIFFGDQNGMVYGLRYNGSAVDGWPQQANDFIKSSPVIADLEGDGDLEIIICSGFTQQHIISVWHHDGTMMAGWPQENGLSFAQPSVGDLDDDGDLEILTGGAIAATPYGRFYVWHHTGTLYDGWPITFPWDGSQYLDYIYAQPVIGDIDNDADMEIIVGSYYKKLFAWHHDATNVTGWPKIIGDAVDSTAAITDVDNDTLVEVVVAGDDGKIYMWDLESTYNASNMEWPMFQYNKHHTGCYGSSTTANQPPVAEFSWTPENPLINQEITFDASASQDSDGVILFYEWDFDNDGVYELLTDTPIITKHFGDSGSHPVNLRVIDNNHSATIITKTVNVMGIELELAIKGGLGVKVEITNKEASEVTDVPWKIHVQGGLLGRINITEEGRIDIPAGETITVSTGRFFGFGAVSLTITAAEEEQTRTGIVLLFFVIGIK